jgi:hemerythrin-like domain-containing protein
MVVIHRAFRRESQLLRTAIAAVTPGDTRRARILADHLRWYRTGLHNHHHGEDKLIWPLLLARVDLEADVVVRMESQHERIARTLDEAMRALPAWESSAGEAARDALVATFTEHRAAVIEHIDDEETHLLPLAAQYLTTPEWAALGEHFLTVTPKPMLLQFLGAVLEDADARERRDLLGALPLPARLAWKTIGRASYARRIRRVRANAVLPEVSR